MIRVVEMFLRLRIVQLLIRLMLDAIYLFAFFILSILVIPRPKLRRNVLHALTRNFWGNALPELDRRPAIWVHADCIGESLASCTLINSLRESRPDLQFVLSIRTSDGMAVASRELPASSLFFAPFDFSWSVRRAFDAIHPDAVLIAENDFWPNFLNEARRLNVPLAIFNTRMSPREQKEHRWNAWLLRPGLERARWWGAVSEQDANWIRHFFRVDAPQLEVTGSLKFDSVIRDSANPRTELLRKKFGFRVDERILVAGSTHSPEEELCVDTVTQLSAEFPQLRLILVPRQVGRCDEIEQLLRRKNVPYARTSQLCEHSSVSQFVTLVDSIGILRDVWGLANYAFVGGSVARHGGQNLIEPASYGIPVCFGPHVWNFQSVADEFLNAEAAVQILSAEKFEQTIRTWMTNPDEAESIGIRARHLVQSRTQSLDRTVRGILLMLPETIPNEQTINPF